MERPAHELPTTIPHLRTRLPARMKTVLITDDTHSEVALMSSVVQRMGYTVLSANDGETCLRIARDQQPDLILLDVVMPILDGFQTCRRLKRDDATAHIPVVVVSTKDQETDKFWAQRQGANGYVTKPFTPELLAETVQRHLS